MELIFAGYSPLESVKRSAMMQCHKGSATGGGKKGENVPKGAGVEVIRAVVKSVKVGNWTIEVLGYIDPEERGGCE